MTSSLKNMQNIMIEKYATIFINIDPSIIKDVILTTNDNTKIEEFLNEINNGLSKTKGEIQNELENNYGIDMISELKFEKNGTVHNNSTQIKPPCERFNRVKKLFKIGVKGGSKGFTKI